MLELLQSHLQLHFQLLHPALFVGVACRRAHKGSLQRCAMSSASRCDSCKGGKTKRLVQGLGKAKWSNARRDLWRRWVIRPDQMGQLFSALLRHSSSRVYTPWVLLFAQRLGLSNKHRRHGGQTCKRAFMVLGGHFPTICHFCEWRGALKHCRMHL